MYIGQRIFSANNNYFGQIAWMYKDKKFCMVQFCVAVLDMLHSTHGTNINIVTEKSKQTVFAQISVRTLSAKIFLSKDQDSSTAYATKGFKDHNKNWTMQNFCSQSHFYWGLICLLSYT